MLRSWRACLHHWFEKPQERRPERRIRSRAHLVLEQLEQRLTPTVDFTISTPVPFTEGGSGGSLVFLVNRTGDAGAAVEVDYTTQDGAGANGARAGIDYTATSGTLFFAAGQSVGNITVPILDDAILQGNHTFTVALSSPRASADYRDPVTFATGDFPIQMVAADVNGDFRADLIVLNLGVFETGNTVSVLLNTTPAGSITPFFSAQQTFVTDANASWLRVADMNGDDRPDVVISNLFPDPSRSTISVLRNTTAVGATTATFAAKQDFAINDAFPFTMMVKDVNGDGRPDVVAQGTGFSSVLRLNTTPAGAGTFTFGAQEAFGGVFNPYYGDKPVDVNGDGRNDVVELQPRDDTLSVRLDEREPLVISSSFAAQQTSAAGDGATQATTADVNGDGKLDLLVANLNAGTVSVLLNTTAAGAAAPTFAAKQDFATGSFANSVTAADINGDGKPDLLVSNGSGTVSLLRNTTAAGATSASFAAQQTFTTGSTPRAVRTADVNGDGRLDLLVANYGATSVSVLLNTTTDATSPSFAAKQDFTTGGNPNSVAAADVNGDGRPDLIVANSGGNSVSVLRNTTAPGATTASFAAKQDFAVGSIPVWVETGDVNGDGRPDLVVANYGANTVSVLLNTTATAGATPGFAAQQAFGTGTGLGSVTAADVNGDGRPDLVVSNRNANTVSVLRNTTSAGATTPSFAAKQDFASGLAPASVAVADVTGDNLPDLVVANFSIDSVSVLVNRPFTFTGNPVTGTIQDNDAPTSGAGSNTTQSANVSAAFAQPLTVTVRNAANQLLQGANVRFTITPAGNGASGTFTGGVSTITVATNSSGIASATFTANATTGSYTVTATVLDASNNPTSVTTTFNLSNRPIVTATTTTRAASAPTVVITGTGFDTTMANNTVSFTTLGAVGAVTNATATQLTVTFSTLPTGTGALNATVTTNGVASLNAQVASIVAAPTVTPNTAPISQNGPVLLIAGTGFSTTPALNTVAFNLGAIGNVTAATATQLTVALTTAPTAVGSLTTVVTSFGGPSGAAVQVATVVAPAVTQNTANLAQNAPVIFIAGVGFSTTAAENTVTFDRGAVGTVLSATATQLIVGFTTPASSLGSLTAIVNVFGGSTGAAVQVATITAAPVVTVNTAYLAPNANTLIITGTGFDPNPLGNTIALNSGAGILTAATSTQLTVTFTAPPALGMLTAVVSAFGGRSGVPVAVGNVNDPPSGSVTISGTAAQGQTLTAANTLADADGLGTITYQWQAGGTDIGGALGTTYVLTEAEVGKVITVVARYTDGHGNLEAATSAATAAVANVNDAPTGSVTITGTAAQGQTLTAANTLADADGLGTIAYQWRADGADIAGATGTTYILTEAEVGKVVTVVARYTDGHGNPEAVTSAGTAAVANVNDAPTGSVTIGGTAAQGQTLTAANTLADADGLGAIAYQWRADGTDISGATGTTFVLTEAEVGKVITVVGSYTDGHGTLEAVTSAGTAAVANANDAPTGTVTITGTAAQGQTLTAANTLADADGLGTITYQWRAGGTDITGAAGTTYVLTEAEVGKVITVVARYTDGHGSLEAVTSAGTAAVANVNDAPTGSVTITGTATQGRTLTAANTLADADGMGTITYQWRAGGTDIAGATGTTYVLTDAEVGKVVTVAARYTDGHGTLEAVSSAATATVANVNDAPSFTKGPDQVITIGQGPQTVPNWATNISVGPAGDQAAGQTIVGFTVTNDNNALFAVQPTISPTGMLTYTAAFGAVGVATVTVTLRDNGGTTPGVDTSAPQTFTIRLNEAPFGPWTSLDGYVKQIAVATNSLGTLTAFGIGGDDALWYKTQNLGNDPTSFGVWTSMGGFVKSFTVGQNGPSGPLQVFAVGGDNAAYTNVESGGGFTAAGWTSLGGFVKQLTVARDKNDKLELFGIGGDNALWYKVQTTGASFGAWQSLGGYVHQIAATTNSDGTVQVFAIGGDYGLWTNKQTATGAGPFTLSFNGWKSLGGYVTSIAVGQNQNGTLQVFASGGDHALWTRRQTAGPTDDAAQFTAWASLGGVILPPVSAAARNIVITPNAIQFGVISAVRHADGTLEAFVVGADNAAYGRKQSTPGGSTDATFDAYVSYGGYVKALASGQNRTNGTVQILGIGGDNALWTRGQDIPGPLVLNGPAGTGAAALRQGDLDALVAAALTRWQAAGLTAEKTAELRRLNYRIEDLPGGELGREAGGAITVDADGAGWGWFVDATPALDEEFVNGASIPDGPAAGRVDLLSVLMHEMGHALGLEHADDGLMAASLATSVRLDGVNEAVGAFFKR